MEKKILYYSNSRFPLATVAGAIHTGQLPGKKDLGAGSLRNLPFLNIKSGREGEIFFLGKDDCGNDIHALFIKGERGMPHRLVESFLRINKISRSNLVFVDCKIGDNWFLLAGRLLNNAGFLAPLGCFFTCAGIKKIYKKLTCLISEVRGGMGKSLD